MQHPLDLEETFYVATKLCLLCSTEILTLSESYPGLPLWRELPGGKISKADADQPTLFTLGREIEEELGVQLEFTEDNTMLFHIEKRYEKTTKGEIRPFIFLCYLYEIDEKLDFILSEHSEYQWIQENEIKNFSDWRLGFDVIVQKAFSTLKTHH